MFEKLSLGKVRTVRGIKVRQAPLGAYLVMLDRIKTAPSEFMAACFPGMGGGDILERLSKLDKDGLAAILGGALETAPKLIISLAAELIGVDEERLINDESIGLIGLVELLDAFVEVNGLGELRGKVGGLMAKLRRGSGTSTGSSGS